MTDDSQVSNFAASQLSELDSAESQQLFDGIEHAPAQQGFNVTHPWRQASVDSPLLSLSRHTSHPLSFTGSPFAHGHATPSWPEVLRTPFRNVPELPLMLGRESSVHPPPPLDPPFRGASSAYMGFTGEGTGAPQYGSIGDILQKDCPIPLSLDDYSFDTSLLQFGSQSSAESDLDVALLPLPSSSSQPSLSIGVDSQFDGDQPPCDDRVGDWPVAPPKAASPLPSSKFPTPAPNSSFVPGDSRWPTGYPDVASFYREVLRVETYRNALIPSSKLKRVGYYTLAERKAKIAHFREKRARSIQRLHAKDIAYKVRKDFADDRPRVNGRFTKKTEGDWTLADQKRAVARQEKKEARLAAKKARKAAAAAASDLQPQLNGTDKYQAPQDTVPSSSSWDDWDATTNCSQTDYTPYAADATPFASLPPTPPTPSYDAPTAPAPSALALPGPLATGARGPMFLFGFSVSAAPSTK